MKIGIFHVTSTFVLGGSETHVWKLTRFLADRGHTCHLWGGEVNSPNIPDSSVILKTAPFIPRKNVLKLGSRFQKFIERASFARHANQRFQAERYDIINIHKPYDIPAALWWKRKTGAKIVWRCHGTDFYPSLASVIGKVDAIYCVSEFAREALCKAYPVSAEVIHTGVDSAFFCPVPPAPGLNPVPRILYFGRLEGWKGVRFLVDALAQIREQSWIAEIVGNGPEEESLRHLIGELNLEHRILLRPALKERAAVRELLAGADLVIFPAIGVETFSNALLEAMSMEKAIIASNVGGFPEVIQHGVNGLLVPPMDVTELARAIQQLIDAPTIQDAYARKARSTVMTEFDASNQFLKVEKLFHQLAAPISS